MRIDVLTLFPQMFEGVLGASILKRAAEPLEPMPGQASTAGRPPAVSYHLHDIRDYTRDKHSKVDAPPFGGGPGMVLQAQPLWDAVRAVEALTPPTPTRIVLTPTGRPLTQPLLETLATLPRLLLIAGHYEGFDQRVLDRLHEQPKPPDAAAEEDGLLEVSIGDYVLSGGELPATVLIDAVVRLLPGVLGHEASAHQDSFSPGTERLLDCPHYTRPRQWEGREVPDVLLGGDHAKIAAWRAEQSRQLTGARRPDLSAGGGSGGGGAALLVTLRDAVAADAEAIAAVHREAFAGDAEAALVKALEAGGHAMFSIVAEHRGRVVGHVMLSEMTHAQEPGRRGALGLGPIAVEPALQRRGIGTALVEEAIRQCRATRVRALFVLGDPAWYARRGFVPAASRGWSSEYPEAGDAFAVFCLVDDPLPPGLVRYAPPFAALS